MPIVEYTPRGGWYNYNLQLSDRSRVIVDAQEWRDRMIAEMA